MKTRSIVYLAAAVCVFLPVFALAGEAPPVVPADFGGAEAHWLWQLAIADAVVDAVWWLLTAGVSAALGWLGLRGTLVARGVVYVAAAVNEIYAAFVRPAKQRAANGKLSESDRKAAMDMALARAGEIARERGLELGKIMSKEVIGAVAEFCVRWFKGGSRAGALVPLSASAPLPPSA